MIEFVRTRHDYQSYWDFWRLVEVSGFSWCHLDEMDLDDPDKTYIFTPFNGEILPYIGRARRCRLIWWNLERPDGNPRPIREVVDHGLSVADEAWVSDRWYASLDPRFKFVLMGSHPEFGDTTERPILHDYTHLSYAWGRRADLYRKLRQRGLREAPEAYSLHDKNEVLNRSRVVLSLHQYEGAMIAPLRFAVAAAYQRPVLTETCNDLLPFVDGETVLQAPYEKLGDVIGALLRDEPKRRYLGYNLYRFLCHERTFRREVIAAATSGSS